MYVPIKALFTKELKALATIKTDSKVKASKEKMKKYYDSYEEKARKKQYTYVIKEAKKEKTEKKMEASNV